MQLTTQNMAVLIERTTLVLKTLRLLNRTMTYGEFSMLVGLRAPEEAWNPMHRKAISQILNCTAAVNTEVHGDLKDEDFALIVNAATGQPGQGINRDSRITRS